MFEPTRRTLLRAGLLAGTGFALAGPTSAQPEEEEEEIPLNAKNIPTINPGSRGLVPVTVEFDPGIGTTPGLVESLVLGPLRAEPEHAAHVERYSSLGGGAGGPTDAWKVLFDPRTADTWFQPGDSEAFVQTTTAPVLRDVDHVRVVAGRQLPDLVPAGVSRSGTDLLVAVENRGTGEADPSTTRVTFGAHGGADRETPALAPGASEQLTFGIPAGCFDPDCEFAVAVDADDDVTESNEGNNDLDGTFIG